MGKCSGLKGGGHHRKAVDLAEKKKNEKLNRKKEQAAAGKRAVILRDVLCKIDPHCDLYLDAVLCDGNKHGFHDKSNCHSNNNDNSNNNNNNDNKLPDLCRAHFRHEGCTNKRCKFSHDYSISEALANVVSGTNTNTNTNTSSTNTDTDHDHDESAPTLPALRHLPGIHGDLGKKKKKKRRLFLLPDDSHSQSQSTSTQSPFGNALSVLEGSSAIDTIVSCLESNQDVVSFGLVCKRLCMLVLEGTTGNDNDNGNDNGNGVGCRDVQWRKHRCKERTLERRNNMLLSTKALSGSLRYAVVYFENNRSSTSSKVARSGKGGKKNHTNKSNKSKSNKPPSLRPVLVFDYENPHVYKAFQESGQVVNSKEHCLSSAMAKDCTIHKTGE